MLPQFRIRNLTATDKICLQLRRTTRLKFLVNTINLRIRAASLRFRLVFIESFESHVHSCMLKIEYRFLSSQLQTPPLTDPLVSAICQHTHMLACRNKMASVSVAWQPCGCIWAYPQSNPAQHNHSDFNPNPKHKPNSNSTSNSECCC